MSKRELWRRIDYDPTLPPLIIDRTTQVSGGVTREEVQALIDSYIEIQYVDNVVDVNLFRSVQGPYKGESADFRVPSSAIAGDLLIVFGSAQYNSHDIEPQMSGSYSRAEADATGAVVETSGDPSSYGAICATSMYALQSADIGTTLTYTWSSTEYNDQLLFFILLEKGAYNQLVSPDSYGLYYHYRFGTEGSDIALDALTIYAASTLLYGSNAAEMPAPPTGAVTMIDTINGQNRLLVLFRLRAASDSLASYGWSSVTNSVTAMVDVIRS